MGKKFSGIVVYTIHGGDEQNALRNCLRQKIEDAFRRNPLDESTYGIPINGENREVVVKKLKKICEDAAKESECQFSNDDFVNLYYPTRKEEMRGNDGWIYRKEILKTKKSQVSTKVYVEYVLNI